MNDDAGAIRKLIETWLAASAAGDTPKVLSLMADDVIFTVAGQKPFGKKEFAAASEGMKNVRIEAKSDILEITVHADWAWVRTHLAIVITPPNGTTMRRSGHTLTIVQKNPDGAWVVARDANMLTLE